MDKRWIVLATAALWLAGWCAPALAQEGDPFPLPPLEPITAENVGRIELLATLGDGNLYETAWSPDGQTLAISGKVDKHFYGIWLYDANDFEAEPRLLGIAPLFARLLFSPDGSLLTSVSSEHFGTRLMTIVLWDMTTNDKLIIDQDCILIVSGNLAFSPDGTIAASGEDITNRPIREDDYGIWLWEAATGEPITALKGHGPATSLAFNLDGSKLFSVSGPKIVVWDMKTHGPLAILDGGTYLLCMALSPDGSVFATGGVSPRDEDSIVKIWDATTYEELFVLEGHTWIVTDLAFTPDSSVLASGGRDSTIRLWDTRTGAAFNALTGPWESVSHVAFNPDGTLLASGSGDGMIRLWGVPADDSP